MPRLGLALTKKAVNQVEDIMGLQTGIDSVFGLHHLAHAHNAEVHGGDSLGGQTVTSMRQPPAGRLPPAMPAAGASRQVGQPEIARTSA
jgi:hypothetical protein